MFQAWLIIFFLLLALGFWKRNAIYLLISGVLIIGFGHVLTFDGLRIISGFNSSTGMFNYLRLLPTNDPLMAIISIVTLPLGISLALYSISVLFTEIVKDHRLFA